MPAKTDVKSKIKSLLFIIRLPLTNHVTKNFPLSLNKFAIVLLTVPLSFSDGLSGQQTTTMTFNPNTNINKFHYRGV